MRGAWGIFFTVVYSDPVYDSKLRSRVWDAKDLRRGRGLAAERGKRERR